MVKAASKNCVWYREDSVSGCKLMTELICSRRKCSFCETERQFLKRQKEFEEKHPELQNMKVCARCKQLKNMEEFNFLHSSKDGREQYCRECKNEMRRMR